MTTIFIGGSRRISRLSDQVQERLHNVINGGAQIIVGDANGADKAVQKFLSDNAYRNVTVFCSGDVCRNNLGHWETRSISASDGAKGFHFYAAKDRVMADNADFGFMIWDGKSAGTILNILRLVRIGKKAVLLNLPEKSAMTFKSARDWLDFVSQLDANFRDDLRKRAAWNEWIEPQLAQQPSFSEEPELFTYAEGNAAPPAKSEDDNASEINAAIATGDPAGIIEALGMAAKARGMSQIAKEAGLARESLYRSLSSGGNPEFTTVLKVLAALGLRLFVRKQSDHTQNDRP